MADILVGAFPERKLKVIMASQPRAIAPSDRSVIQAWPDTSRLRALGWTPRTGIAEGFKRTVLSVEETLEDE